MGVFYRNFRFSIFDLKREEFLPQSTRRTQREKDKRASVRADFADDGD
jgi:hypothetical protein